MLAIEPTADVPSSVEVKPGTPAAVGAGVSQLDWDVFVSQHVILDWIEWNNAPGSRAVHRVEVDNVSDLIRYTRASFFHDAVAYGIVRIDPSDATKFQLRRKLHIVFPADPADFTRVKRGRRLPVALLVHGNHAAVEGGHVVESHLGYDYLQQELAAQGIVSVSVDTNAANAFNAWIDMRAESVLGALDQMRAMDGDSSSIFHKRLDFDRVALMGHSRGGDAAVKAAILNAARTTAKYNLRAVCSLAATDLTGTVPAGSVNSLNQSHTRFFAVVYGALDGDVHGCDVLPDPILTVVDRKVSSAVGTVVRHYDRATVARAMVFFDECGHNRFNKKWPSADPFHYSTSATLLSAEKHESLAIEYIGGLFRWHLLGHATQSRLFDGSVSNKVGAGAAIQWSFPNAVALDEFETGGHGTLSAGAIVDSTAQLVEKRAFHQTRVLAVKPVAVDSDVYVLSLSGAQRDWTRFTHFTFRVCADADVTSSSTIAGNPLPEFELVFTDSAGNDFPVSGVSLRTAERPRRPVFHEVLIPELPSSHRIRNATVIRFETFAIEIASFIGLNVADLATITLRAPASFAKDQFFDSFQLIKR